MNYLIMKHAAFLLVSMMITPCSAIRVIEFKEKDIFPIVDQSLYSCCPQAQIERFVEANFTNSATKAPFSVEELMNAHGEDHQDLFLYEHVFRYLPADPGHFIEFGAREGSTLSNTFFYEKNFGWEGVLIEAMFEPPHATRWDGRGDPWFVQEMHKTRTCRANGLNESACILGAVSDIDGKFLTMRNEMTSDAHSGPGRVGILDENGNPINMELQDTDSGVKGDQDIPTVTLNSIIQRFRMKGVDLISMDCEGCENKALQGLDLATNRVKVILLERSGDYCANHKILRNHGYFNVQGPGFDEIYIHPEVASQIPKPPKMPFERTMNPMYPDNCAEPMAWTEWPGPA